MTFTIEVKVDTTNMKIKDECLQVLAQYLSKKGCYFDVGYDPREIDFDSLGTA